MKRMRLAMGVVVVLMNLALLAATGLAQPGRYQATVNESDQFEAKNDERRVELEVCSTAKRMTLRMKVQLTRGMVTWRLLDPKGQVQAEGEAMPGVGAGPEVRNVAPMEGRWVLEIKWLGATGSHNVNWQVR